MTDGGGDSRFAYDDAFLASARAFLEERDRKDDARRRDLHAQAARDAAAIVEAIRERFSPTRIYQWGSLLDPAKFREYSDIDVAVEGVSDPRAFFDMLDLVHRLTSFPVDLVQMERIEPEFADLIRRFGRLVYERPE